MRKNERNGVDPSYFCELEAEGGDVVENEEFYEKGKKRKSDDGDIHMENDDVLVLPGERGESDMHVDMASARKIVKDLHENYANVAVKTLSGESKRQFLTLHEVIEALKGTEAHKYIHDMIISEFQCNHDHHFKIGTVGAYFCECKSDNTFPGNKSCSLGCLLGMENGGCKTEYPCEYTCISYNGDGGYSTLYEVEGVAKAYLFVNDKFTFEGIYPGEYKYFRKLGIEEVKIVKHSDGLSYQEITSDFVPVRNLILQGNSVNNVEEVESNAAVAIIVIVVLILLIAGFGGWYYYKKGKRFVVQ